MVEDPLGSCFDFQDIERGDELEVVKHEYPADGADGIVLHGEHPEPLATGDV